MLNSRWRRATLAAVASLCASAAVVTTAQAAQGDLPRITQNAPAGITMNFWDDHSLSGDDHLGWSHEGSQGEPLAIYFQASVDNDGPGVLQLCAGAGGTQWRGATQTAPAALGNCSGPDVSTGDLWFRYAIANHDQGTEFNRWHAMDLQRFALVPLTADGLNADTSRPTLWDNQWGTCLLDDGGMACPQNAGAGAFGVGISAGTHKLTQEGAPDQAVIAFRSLEMLAAGAHRYQVVAMSNPYGALAEDGTTSGSVNCTDVQITTDQVAGTFALTELPGAPAHCFLPQTMQSAVNGSGPPAGVDPFVGAAADETCVLHTADEVTDPATQGPGHCWLTIPTTNTGITPPHPLAASNVSDARAGTATSVIAVVPGSPVRSTGGGTDPGDGGGTVQAPTPTPTPVPAPLPKPGPAPGPKPRTSARSLPVPELDARTARKYTRKALRKTFHVLPRSAKVSCKLTGGASASCTASWKRPHGRRYRGRVHVWFSSNSKRVSWNYDVKFKKRQHGRTTTLKRAGRTGGTVA